jgi:hypothetical protein
VDGFLTPFIPRSQYKKIVRIGEYFDDHNLSLPIVVFGGYPNVGLVTLYRNYIGVEIGEHFAYYGEIANLLKLIPSQPRVNSTTDPYLSQIEKLYLTSYFNELVGNITGPPPTLYYHDLHVTNETLTSYTILIVTPEFYTEEIPYYIKPFYIGDGIYVVPPNSINRSVVNLTEYTSRTPDFSIRLVDHINFAVYSTVGKKLSFWIDDLTVDTSLNLEKFIYKDRAPIDETVIAHSILT